MASTEAEDWYASGKDPAPVVEPPDPERGDLAIRDHLADYDVHGRKQLKRLGFMEVLRGLPWMLADNFGRFVPDETVVQVAEGIVEIPCYCKATTEINYNTATSCSGDCGRWFWWIAGGVRVGYDPERPAPNA